MAGSRNDLQRVLVERFAEKLERDTAPVTPDSTARIHLRRFMKIVDSRKQQILDKLLMD